MSEVQQQEGSDRGGKHKKVRAKKSSTHVDMTPMVDLAFLLLTFFIMTTTFSKPKTMDITMPVKDNVEDKDRTKVPASQTMSVILTADNKVIWYFGQEDPAQPPVTSMATFSQTGENSIHKIILEKNALVNNQVKAVEDSVKRGLIEDKEDVIKAHKSAVKNAEKKGLIVLIKPDESSKYNNLVDILDEMLVCNVARYAIVDLSESEKELVKNTK